MENPTATATTYRVTHKVQDGPYAGALTLNVLMATSDDDALAQAFARWGDAVTDVEHMLNPTTLR